MRFRENERLEIRRNRLDFLMTDEADDYLLNKLFIFLGGLAVMIVAAVLITIWKCYSGDCPPAKN